MMVMGKKTRVGPCTASHLPSSQHRSTFDRDGMADHACALRVLAVTMLFVSFP
jgi:hypothetical protein